MLLRQFQQRLPIRIMPERQIRDRVERVMSSLQPRQLSDDEPQFRGIKSPPDRSILETQIL